MVQCGDILWSLSFEPIIIGWNLAKEDLECIVPTFRGLNALVPSPQFPSLVVMGGVDMHLRSIFMDDGYPECSSSRRPNMTFRLRGKITCVSSILTILPNVMHEKDFPCSKFTVFFVTKLSNQSYEIMYSTRCFIILVKCISVKRIRSITLLYHVFLGSVKGGYRNYIIKKMT